MKINKNKIKKIVVKLSKSGSAWDVKPDSIIFSLQITYLNRTALRFATSFISLHSGLCELQPYVPMVVANKVEPPLTPTENEGRG